MSIFIIAPLSCSAPIYKDLLSSPLHLKFSFISTRVTAKPAGSWSIFLPAAGKSPVGCAGLPAPSSSPFFAPKAALLQLHGPVGSVEVLWVGVEADAMVLGTSALLAPVHVSREAWGLWRWQNESLTKIIHSKRDLSAT